MLEPLVASYLSGVAVPLWEFLVERFSKAEENYKTSIEKIADSDRDYSLERKRQMLLEKLTYLQISIINISE